MARTALGIIALWLALPVHVLISQLIVLHVSSHTNTTEISQITCILYSIQCTAVYNHYVKGGSRILPVGVTSVWWPRLPDRGSVQIFQEAQQGPLFDINCCLKRASHYSYHKVKGENLFQIGNRLVYAFHGSEELDLGPQNLIPKLVGILQGFTTFCPLLSVLSPSFFHYFV